MAEQGKNILIGLFILAACFLIVGIVFFIQPTVGDGGQSVYVRFPSIDKVAVGTRVSFAGRPVGQVVAIREVPDARSSEKTKDGQVYFFELELELDSSVEIFDTDQVSVETSGLLGEKSVAINPKMGKEGETSRIVNNEILFAEPRASLEDAFGKALNIADNADELLGNLNELIKDHKNDISETFATLKEGSKSFSTAMTELTPTLREMREKEFGRHLSSAIKSADILLESLNDPEAWKDIVANIRSASANFKDIGPSMVSVMDKLGNAADQLDRMFVRVSEGEGTLGKLIQQDELYLSLNGVMDKAHILMNDINHYGLLFHHDKRWQRQRMARMNEAESLQDPDAFRIYVEEEIDEIQTSLARVSLLMAEPDTSRDSGHWKTEYAKSFANLLRRVQTLEETLKEVNSEIQSP